MCQVVLLYEYQVPVVSTCLRNQSITKNIKYKKFGSWTGRWIYWTLYSYAGRWTLPNTPRLKYSNAPYNELITMCRTSVLVCIK